MISTEEYLKAVKIVEQHHEEIKAKINVGKTRFDDWDKLERTSVRLNNTLKRIMNYRHNESDYIFEYIEDVHHTGFFSILGAGKKTWGEFIGLRGF